MNITSLLKCLAALLVLASSAAHAGRTPAVLLISVDGLDPDYVIDADGHGLEIPTLRQFLVRGAYAAGVVNVTPTLTYPNHTSIITGEAPAEHGIQGNAVCGPEGLEQGAGNWYGSQIRVPTLWDAAKGAGMTT